jgi:protocatechuate 3,4-dioxygenase beta subunit
VHRRDILLAALGTSLASMLSPRTRAATPATAPGSCVLTPTGSEGPFYFDPKLVRSNIVDGCAGVPLELAMTVVTTPGCAPIKGARADVWHADADGLYSGYRDQSGTGDVPASAKTNRTFLRGTQFTDDSGTVTFRTIYPSWYRGRTPHIHFKVFVGKDEMVTNQIIFPENVNTEVFKQPPYRDHKGVRDSFNANDRVLRSDGSGVLCSAERSGEIYRATLVVGVASKS